MVYDAFPFQDSPLVAQNVNSTYVCLYCLNGSSVKHSIIVTYWQGSSARAESETSGYIGSVPQCLPVQCNDTPLREVSWSDRGGRETV